MVKQAVWIGIVIGVFFAGVGIGYATLWQPASLAPQTMTQQQMRQIMSDPDSRQQMMNQWMHQANKDPQLKKNAPS